MASIFVEEVERIYISMENRQNRGYRASEVRKQVWMKLLYHVWSGERNLYRYINNYFYENISYFMCFFFFMT